jgi:uncharacterized repeat protein (TIGR01451 family)
LTHGIISSGRHEEGTIVSIAAARSGPRTLTALAVLGLLVSLLAVASPVAAEEPGNIAIFKTMCDSIGSQDTCNGRDTSLAGWHIDYTVQEDDAQGATVQTIVVTLGENAGGGGNTGGGSQGRAEGAALPAGTYLVCEVPVAYNDEVPRDEIPLDVLARPEASGGGSTGGNQQQVGDECILFDLGTGTEELKYLDQVQPEPETGSLVVLKTSNATPPAPLAGATFSVTDEQGAPVGDGSFTTQADGTFCVQNLEVGATYTVTETLPPPGFLVATPATQNVVADEFGTCAEREAGPDATFVNRPVPTLIIDKAASTETITITGPNEALVATPSIVTWTLTYTLSNGPATGVVITDPVPAGFAFLDAANGGSFAAGTVTWNLGTVTASGSVSFRTTVNAATISRATPTVNTATIDSDQTPPDTGQDSVTVNAVPPALSGNPTPAPTPTPAPVIREGTQAASVPNTAIPLPAVGVSAALLALASLMVLGLLGRRAAIRRRSRR